MSVGDVLGMAAKLRSPQGLLPTWEMLRRLPGGGSLMGRLVGRMAPYTGTIKPDILELGEGYARVQMKDRPELRNHLKSVHAIALMNLGEVSTGVAMLSRLPEGARAIIVHLGMDYAKKARGTIVAECHAPLVDASVRQEYEVTAELKDEGGAVVATAQATWLVGPAASA